MGLELNLKWISIAVVFGGIIVFFLVIGYALEPPSVSSPVSTPPKEIIVTKSPEQLLPVRNDIGTIWTIKTSIIDKTLGSETNIITGFTVGDTQRYTKPEEGIVNSLVDVGVFMFDNPTNSLNFYTGKIQRLVEKGGFEETHARANDATCYGLKKSEQSGFIIIDINELRCVKGNVYVYVRSYSDTLWGDNYAPEFMRIVLDKIV